MTLFSLAFLLFVLMDAPGNVPIFIAILKEIPVKRQRSIILREMILALLIIILFYFIGGPLLKFLNISQNAVLISGGVILFLIALKLIFPSPKTNHWSHDKEPFLVPLAIPLVAGPAVLSSVVLYSHAEISTWIVLMAIFIAWFFTTLILIGSSLIRRILGDRGISACEKLMGLFLIMISVQMFINGITEVFS
jgi:MarC family membrane protein